MDAFRTKTNTLADVKALIRLSNFGKGITPKRIERLVKKAPDPETICQLFLEEIPIPSEVLQRKWRKTLHALWADQHPHLPHLPSIPITREWAGSTDMLLDALGVLEALSQKPGQLTRSPARLLDAAGSQRLAQSLESLTDVSLGPIGSELDVPGLARLRALLEAAGLIGVQRGRLSVNTTRLRRFFALPRSYQFYILWHCDVYHVAWEDFVSAWHDCIHDIQDSLPLLWEVSQADPGEAVPDKQQWCLEVAYAFTSLWSVHLGRGFLFDLSLATTINQVILNDLFARYGLIQFERGGNFVWTPLGSSLLQAEIDQTLPCGLELLR